MQGPAGPPTPLGAALRPRGPHRPGSKVAGRPGPAGGPAGGAGGTARPGGAAFVRPLTRGPGHGEAARRRCAAGGRERIAGPDSDGRTPGWGRARPAYLRSRGPPFYFLNHARNASRSRTASTTGGPRRACANLRPLGACVDGWPGGGAGAEWRVPPRMRRAGRGVARGTASGRAR